MATHRRGWLLRAALVAVLAAVGLSVTAVPAFADGTISVNVAPLPDFNAGQTQTMTVTVTVSPAQAVTVTVTVNNLQNITIGAAQKTVVFKAGDTQATATFDVKASNNVQPGQTATGSGKISATASSEAVVGIDQKLSR